MNDRESQAKIPRFRCLGPWLWLSLVVFGSCGSGAQSNSGSSPDAAADDDYGTRDGGYATCGSDPRAQTYEPGRVFPSLGGLFAMRLLESQPGPPIKGFNTWTVEVTASRSPPTATTSGASTTTASANVIAASGFMPDHGHGTDPIVVTQMGTGLFKLDPVRLKMSGYWEVTVEVRDDGSDIDIARSDRIVLTTCIP